MSEDDKKGKSGRQIVEKKDEGKYSEGDKRGDQSIVRRGRTENAEPVRPPEKDKK